MHVELLFLGTGTSAGIPMIACRCPVCTSSDPHDRRNRCSVTISYGDATVLVDTTPELRLQCVTNDVRRIDALVYTHAHADHVMGLDDVRRFNAVSGKPLDVWADERTHASLTACFGYAFRAPDPASRLFRPHLVPRTIHPPQRFEIAGVPWTPIPLIHGQVGVLGFRVGNLAYCTDVSHIPDASYDLLQGLDILILDALQHTPHDTHFTLAQAQAAADRIGPRQTYFTHIAHGLAHAATNAALPPHQQLAHDGLRVTATM